MVQFAVSGFGIDFDVGDGGVEFHVPVNDSGSAINQAAIVPRLEFGHHGFGVGVIEREAYPLPIVGTAEFLELKVDASAVLFAPFPTLCDKRFTPEIVPRFPLFRQFALDNGLRRNPGVIGSGKAQCRKASHAMPARHRVENGIVEGVPHVEASRDVGRRNRDAVRGLVRVGFGVKDTALFPRLVPPGFDVLRTVALCGFRAFRGWLDCCPGH